LLINLKSRGKADLAVKFVIHEPKFFES
jgi:hypothetical protein